MMLTKQYLLLLLLLIELMPMFKCAWNGFDLVRPWMNAWGSSGNTSFIKISPLSGNGPNVSEGSFFGCSVANIGDLDGDGVDDIVVGAKGEGWYGINGVYEPASGAIYILFMSDDGNVKTYQKIDSTEGGGPILFANDNFGFSVASVGDMNGDNITDIAVGAPGFVVSSVYILFLHRNGTVARRRLIRGAFDQTPTTIPTQSPGTMQDPTSRPSPLPISFSQSQAGSVFVPNGPPIRFKMRFGSSLANVGDLNGDNIPELAVGAANEANGNNEIYILFMTTEGTVWKYTVLGSNKGGIPDLTIAFSYFGSSIITIGDINNDNITDIAIGAKYYDDLIDSRTRSGIIFVCFMLMTGMVENCTKISGLAESEKGTFPSFLKDDYCGAAVGSIGDINKDSMRQHNYLQKNYRDNRRNIGDIVIGCPQPDTGIGTGKLFLIFLTDKGSLATFRELPGPTDVGIGPKLLPGDQFGSSIAGFQDLDSNGILEIIVGAPGDSDGGVQAGSIYILYLRRRRFHPPVPNTGLYLFLIIFPIACCSCSCFWGCIFFFWYFRRRPDIAEIAVKASSLEIGKSRERKYVKKSQVANVNDDEYPT